MAETAPSGGKIASTNQKKMNKKLKRILSFFGPKQFLRFDFNPLSCNLSPARMGGGSVQEQVTKLAEEIEGLKDEIASLKSRLQKKREEMKALKKSSEHPSQVREPLSKK